MQHLSHNLCVCFCQQFDPKDKKIKNKIKKKHNKQKNPQAFFRTGTEQACPRDWNKCSWSLCSQKDG